MKKILSALVLGLLMIGQFAVMAQSVQISRSDYSSATVRFVAPELDFTILDANGTAYTQLVMEGAAPSAVIGQPNLPVLSQLIEIPVCNSVAVRVQVNQTKALSSLKYPVMPVQPAPSKSDRKARPFAIDSAFYALDTDLCAHAWVETLGVGRDRNLAMLRISPVFYNPVSDAISIATDMTITLAYEGADAAATEQLHSRYYSPDFALGGSLLSTVPAGKSIRNAAPLHYLIVAHSSFRGTLDSLVDWKRSRGMLVTVAYTDDPAVGTSSSSIAAYIKSFYTNATDELPAPTFLLLVGDHQQIPAFNARCYSPASDHVTDLYYATWTDGDNIPDCYMGRFSARTVAELTPQIEKTLYYEKYLFDDDSFLGTGVLIAGEDRGVSGDNAYNYADPAMDYIAKTYVNIANGYRTIHYYKNNTGFAPTGVYVNGSSQTTASAATLRTLYNQGCGWVNYSAHGYDDCWGTPEFSTSNVNNMTNNGKPGIMIGNCCLSGRFNTTSYDACLGEALLRKGNNAGAVAYFGATNSTYWPHDFCWSVGVRSGISNTMNASYNPNNLGMYDRLFHTHNENYNAWHITAGSMNVAGNTAVQAYGSYDLYYWEIYELFGDPSLMPYLGQASDMEPDCDPIIFVGSDSYSVTAAPYAYVALTSGEEHTLVSAAYADADGVAILPLPGDLVPGTLSLSVWAQNRKPYTSEVTVTVRDGAYVMLTDMAAEGAVRAGSTVNFDVTIANLGNAIPTAGLITFASATEGVYVINPVAHFTHCDPGDTVTLHAACPIFISESLADGQPIVINATVDFGSGTSLRRKTFAVSAAKLVCTRVECVPTLAPGQTSVITCGITNQGSQLSNDCTYTLVNDFGILAVSPDPVHLGLIAPGDTRQVSFSLTLSDQAPFAVLPFYLYAASPRGTQLVATIQLRCGEGGVEDFESGTFDEYAWTQSNRPWEITTGNPQHGTYCARSRSNLNNRSESRMTITWSSPIDDSISFYYKVSSEEGYDKFHFYIDGSERMEASGQVGWTRVSYAVPAGQHIFAFSYSKDYSSYSGSDCAWIDNITFPFSGTRCHFTADSICQGGSYQFAGQEIPTDQLGTFDYVDSSAAEHQYLALTVLPAPEVAVEVIGEPVAGHCVLLRARGADSYVWSTGDSTECIIVCPDSTAAYSVTGYRHGCTAEAGTTLLSIGQPAAETQVSLYPNPAHEQVAVAAENLRSVQLLNLMGQVVCSRQGSDGSAILDLCGLPAGIYLVRIETAQTVVVKKLVRQ